MIIHMTRCFLVLNAIHYVVANWSIITLNNTRYIDIYVSMERLI